MRLHAFKVIVQYRTPLTSHVLRKEPMLVYGQNREYAARIARDYASLGKVEGELPFVDIKEITDLGPVAERMS